MAPSAPPSRLVKLAMAAAAFGVAAHVVGKAARDALFVSTFPPSALPYVFLGTGVASGIAIAVYARLQARYAPHGVSPRLPIFVAASLVVMWLWLRTGSAAATAVLYAWVTITGTLVISSFWALFSELLDVRSARRAIGVLTVASSVGGLLGAVATHWFLTLGGARSLLLPLAGINLVIAALLGAMSRSSDPVAPKKHSEATGGLMHGARTILGDRYLSSIAGLVMVTAIAGTFGDFILKSTAATSIGDETALTEFFATYHGVVGGLTLGIQLVLARPLLQRRGLGASLAVLPAFLVLSGVAFVIMPVMATAAGLRGGESSARNSFHRAAYELLFVPVRADVKRVAKLVIDTFLERLADSTGALLLIVMVAAGWASLVPGVLVAVLGAAALVLVPRVRRGYVASLTTNLVDQAVALDDISLAVESDATARHTLHLSLGDADHAALQARLARKPSGRTQIEATPHAPGGTLVAEIGAVDPEPREVALIRDLRARDRRRVEGALSRWNGDRLTLPFVVEVLEREELFEKAVAALSPHADRHAGALADELCDARRPVAVRKRIPRVLARATEARASHGLYEVLADEHFIVRYHAVRALRALAESGIEIDEDRIWAALGRDVRESLPVWEAQRLIDDGMQDDLDLRGAVARRGAAGLRHVFNLLALVLDAEPIDLVYRSIAAEDENVRAVALEYLEHVLPEDLRVGLWPYIGDTPTDAPPVSRRAVHELLRELERNRPAQ